MFGIGFPELLVILAIALMVIGPRRLPDIAKALGRAMGEFKRATDEFKQSINEETRASEIREQILKGGKLYPPEANQTGAPDEVSNLNKQDEEFNVNPKPTPLGPLASAVPDPETEPATSHPSPETTDDRHDG